MAYYLLLGMVVAFSFRAMVGWRAGILMMVVLAALQDPLRKLVPGTPSWLVLATVPVFAAMVFTSVTSTRRWWADFRKSYPSVAKALVALVVLSLPAAVISASYGEGSWLLTVFGAFSYSVIFMGVVAGFHYARRAADIRRLLVVYCLLSSVMLSGSLFEYLGWFEGWEVLGDEALGYNWFRSQHGYVVDIICGFYRSGDVMGWHAAAVTALSVVLAMSGRGSKRYLWLAVSGFAVVALLLCGRRKMVFMLPVFAVALGWLYWQAGRAAKVWSLALVFAIPVASVWVIGDWLGEESSPIRYYTETSDETLDRFQDHGFGSVWITYKQFGFFGAGLGTATPGSHNLDVERPYTWQESGTSRILVELGVPGTLGFIAVMASILLGLLRVTRDQIRRRNPDAPYAAGLVAFFMANVGSLMVSGQILADPFIAAFLGFMVGISMSFARPQLAGVPVTPKRQAPAAADRPHLPERGLRR